MKSILPRDSVSSQIPHFPIDRALGMFLRGAGIGQWG